MQAKTIFYLFIVDTLLNLLAVFLGLDWLNYLTKPLLMTLLALYFYQIAPKTPFTKMVLLGLVFSVGGDVALMFKGSPIYFILGLSSFLIAHVCYIIGMYRFPNFRKGMMFQKVLILLPFLYTIGFLNHLWPDLGEMKIPVVVYGLVITAMGWSALNMKKRVNQSAVNLLIMGAIFFILSDSLIAINKFQGTRYTIPFVSIWIMTTYVLGQYLIVKGTLKAINI